MLPRADYHILQIAEKLNPIARLRPMVVPGLNKSSKFRLEFGDEGVVGDSFS